MPVNTALLERALVSSSLPDAARDEILARYMHLIGSVSKAVCRKSGTVIGGFASSDMSSNQGGNDALLAAGVGGAVAATGLYYAAKKGLALQPAQAHPSGQSQTYVQSLATWLVRGAENLATIVDAKTDETIKGEGEPGTDNAPSIKDGTGLRLHLPVVTTRYPNIEKHCDVASRLVCPVTSADQF